MSSIDVALMGLKNLFRRKARTVLTVLGVVIGTAAIVVMVSLGLGMNKAYEKQLEEYGSLTMIDVYANQMFDSGATNVANKDALVLDDEAIKTFEAMPNVEFAIGFKRFDARINAGKFQNFASIKGVDFEKFKKMDLKLSEGILPTTEGKNEVLFGFQASKNFYDPKARNYSGEPPVVDIFNTKIEMIPSSEITEGKKVRGIVINPTGITTENDWNYSWDIFMDYDTFTKLKKDFDRQNKKSAQANGPNATRKDPRKKENKYDEMKISVSEVKYVEEVQQQVKDLGFQASSLTEALDNMKKTSSMIQAILGGIGAVSLFIAAIGITNTMVMSIYERTREIGVMKVIGAQLWDIKRLFLFEAAMIGLFGGLLGIGMSYGVSYIINTVIQGMGNSGEYYGPPIQSFIPAWLALSSLGFSTVIGLLAGYYPAVRATKLSALEAIKNE